MLARSPFPRTVPRSRPIVDGILIMTWPCVMEVKPVKSDVTYETMTRITVVLQYYELK